MENNKININVMIGTPAYGCLVHIDYLNSVLSFPAPFSVVTLGNESLITRGRNKIYALFHELKEFTHLLFLDADIQLPPKESIKLLETSLRYPNDIICAPVALKSLEKKVLNYGKIIEEIDENILSVEKCGTAIMLIPRSAEYKITQEAIKQNLIYYHNSFYSRGNAAKNLECYDIFQAKIIKGVYESEDYTFCHFARKLGIRILVRTDIINGHNTQLQLYSI